MSYTILLMVEAADGRELSQRLLEDGCEVLEAGNWAEAVLKIRERRIDGVIVDPALFAASTCPEVVQEICRRTASRTAVIILTPTSNLATCRMCSLVRLGMLDCVDAPADVDDVITRLFWLLCYGTPKQVRWPPYSLLSSREQEVLRLLRIGHSDREIAAQLDLAPKAIERYIEDICRKLEVPDRTAAVALSYRRPLFSLSACDGVPVLSETAEGAARRGG